MDRSVKLNRRSFLKTGAGMIGASLAPQIVAASTLGRNGATPPNEKIQLACIGVGGMGNGNTGHFIKLPDCRIVAVCDVKRDKREETKARVDLFYENSDCAVYNDFREALARDDIDAVMIASPDHWHVLHGIAAARAGKDMYLEKPIGMSMEEVKALRAVVRDTGRIFQFGTQQRSSENFRHACALVRNGRIGRLRHIKVAVNAGAQERSGLKEIVPEPVPEGFDYEMWLGPAAEKPYIPQRVITPNWYHTSDYSMGFVTGWGIHHIDIAQWGNGSELTAPVGVEGKAVFPTDDALCDNPVYWDVHYRYANGVTMHFTGNNPDYPGNRHGITFEGDEGWIWVDRGGLESEPESIAKDIIREDEDGLYVSKDHRQNFLDCVRSRKPAICDIEIASCSDIVCQQGWVAFHLDEKLTWDTEAELFVGNDAANALMKHPMRAPWTLA